MKRMIWIAAGLVAVAPMTAAAERTDGALDVRGVLQQGHGAHGGGGGKQESGGGRGQGGGGEARGGGQGRGGGSDARPSSETRQGGGQSGRSSDRAESGRGRSSSSPSSGTRSGGSGRSDDARASSSSSPRGNSGNGGSSASSRGNGGSGGGNSDAARGRGNSGGNASTVARGGPGSSANAASGARGGRHRLSDADVRARVAELPPTLRRMAGSSRPSERMVAGAVARSRARGVDANAFDVREDGGRLRVLNRTGQLLLDLDDDRARDLGAWRLRRLGDRQPAGNAPAFCRSGAGHPVWGREWCLDKGFGLGSRAGTLWSRGGIDDVIWRRRTDDRLDRGGLGGVLGDIILGRLALQAITLGYDQPLVGFWVADPQGPRILRVNSGNYEVAEFVDTNRDDRVDVLYVAQPVW
jgi:hypothetical protein